MSAKEPNETAGHDDHAHDQPEQPQPIAPIAPPPEHGYWKSLRELAGTTEWQQDGASRKEFAPGADQPPPLDPLSRRNFFHLMGASMGLAGIGAVAAGCQRYEKEKIIPLAKRPEDQTPGTTLQYATVYEMGGATHPLVATSFEGRPIHLDGNPEHPFAGGAGLLSTKRRAGAHTFAQASILHLYDPDRSTTPLIGKSGSSMDAFKIALGDIRKAIEAGGAHILAEASSSPTLEGLRNKLTAKGVKWHEYEPISWDNERTGLADVFKRPLRPIAKLDQCMTIVSIDCDLFVEHPASMKYSKDFSASRKAVNNVPGTMSRMYAIESIFSNTGAIADHRLPLRTELGLPFVMALDAALGGGVAPQAEFLKEDKIKNFLAAVVEDLKGNPGKSVVIAGRRQPREVHALVAKINAAIGAVGPTLDYVEDPDVQRVSHLESITELTKAINANAVKTLIILGGNPAYDAPADLDFANALAKVKMSVHLSEYADETSLHTTWHVPKAHFLEAWGDARTHEGTITLAQPLIAPLYGGLSSIELCSLLLGNETAGDQLVQAEHAARGILNWRKNVHDGFVPNTALPISNKVDMTAPAVPALKASQLTGSKRGKNELEVVFHMSSFTYDGRYANNAWLWETPDFLTKVTWDNYALISPETSTALEVANGDVITVKLGDRSVDLPAYTMPGQARYSIGLVLGGGRTEAGHVSQHPHNVGPAYPGKRVVGWDTYKVRTTGGFDYAIGATVTKTGRTFELAEIQDHWSYNPGQSTMMKYDGGFDKEVTERASTGEHPLIKEVTLAEMLAKPEWAAEEGAEFWDDKTDAKKAGAPPPRHLSLFQEHEYSGHRWGMAIDLSTCTGCNACMVACQSENNIPVVGRQEVINNREMSWIRIDRYFTGSPDDPRVVHEPVACQQCENAPCEQVCPVGATQHSAEGLNDMAYNRCIGTRYCANNCPYKVRRFNFLDWNSEFREAREQVRRLIFNPDVTVRMRGVMEKCTYCVQRIQNGKIRVKAQIRAHQRDEKIDAPIPDGEIETACQLACPTEAIVFGDLSDRTSRVAKLHEVQDGVGDRRSYGLLPSTYTKPRTRYLARVRNPNPKLEKPSAEAGAAGGER
ncbi:MAG: TAT-variant-translocated molybdopterin oxidoreductase [Kofleriaceae bacterium]